MSLRPPRSSREIAPAFIALALLAGPRAEASSIHGVTDLGTNVSHLRLNNSGQVAGMQGDGFWDSRGFLDTAGKFASLAPGVIPISLTDDGRVIDARGPYDYYDGRSRHSMVSPDAATAGNHLGVLVGTSFTTPWSSSNDMTRVPSVYEYQPGPPGTGRDGKFLELVAQTPGYIIPSPDDPIGRGTLSFPWTPAVHPTGINDSGQAVGNYFPSDPHLITGFLPVKYDSHAFLGRQDLGTLGGSNSFADAINNAGQVTGRADTAAGSSHAFLDTGGKMVDLGVLPGMQSSEGIGLNEKGDVVGYSGGHGTLSLYGIDVHLGGHAFLYSNGIMEDLNDRLPATSGLTLDEAVAINDAGQILAYGHGADGVEHGLLLSPAPVPTPAPEPTTLALLGLAAAGYGVRRLGNPRD